MVVAVRPQKAMRITAQTLLPRAAGGQTKIPVASRI